MTLEYVSSARVFVNQNNLAKPSVYCAFYDEATKESLIFPVSTLMMRHNPWNGEKKHIAPGVRVLPRDP
jgi:hypothetical protein